MKLALLLPGYIESPDYRHLVVIDDKLTELGYTTVRVDACNLWQTGDVQNYTTTNYIKQVKNIIESYESPYPTEIILVGHSLGAAVAIFVAQTYPKITKIICLGLPISLNNSDYKWATGVRISKKDLPEDNTKFREFQVPASVLEDRLQYSVSDSLKSLKIPVFIVMGQEDPLLAEVETVTKDLGFIKFITIKNMGHDFRQSEELCHLVATEIKNFLT